MNFFQKSIIFGLSILFSSFSAHADVSTDIKVVTTHLLSPRLVSDIKFPYLCLLVSGGNTALVLVKSSNEFITH